MMLKITLFMFFMWMIYDLSYGQSGQATIKDRLLIAETSIPSLSEIVNITANEMEIKDLLYSVGSSVRVNITADEMLKGKVTGTFERVKLSELLLHLSERYSLDFRVTGEIIYFFPFVTVHPQRKVNVMMNDDGMLTIDLKNDSLGQVLKELSLLTGMNFHYDRSLYGIPVTCYMKDERILHSLQGIAVAANLKIISVDSLHHRFEKKEHSQVMLPANSVQPVQSRSVTSQGRTEADVHLSQGVLYVAAEQSELFPLLVKVFEISQTEFVMLSEVKGLVTIHGSFESVDELLDMLLANTPFTYSRHDELIMLGSRLDERLRTSRFYAFRQRTVEGLPEQIPQELKKGIEIRAFPDLNGLIVSGSAPATEELFRFLATIDKKVPVIDIEVYIVDIRDSRSVSAGIQAGLGATSSETSGSVYPSADVHLNSVTVNEVMTGITRLGLLNLGRVGPAFFLKLKLLEEQGSLKIRSTPRLATLNGHEAKMSIGRTEYYLEIQNNVIGTQNPQNLISQQYKSVQADLSLIINPSVSDNEDITLKVSMNQSNFTERISPSAPPGTISREFQSLLRVRNGEMVVLGGLEEDSKSKSSNGLPLLSRIPVLKWLFSARNTSKSKSRLTIFIRPTVIYH